jgi:hypothetical protein
VPLQIKIYSLFHTPTSTQLFRVSHVVVPGSKVPLTEMLLHG